MAVTPFALCVADDATFWAWSSWPRLARWPGKDKALVVMPIAGFFAPSPDSAWDGEETELTERLAAASRELGSPEWLLVVPPLRFVAGPDPRCVFAVPPPVAHAWIEEVAGSIAAAGFRKILLFNASPWNEEVCAAAARDLHVARDLDLFCLHLSGLRAAGCPPLSALLRELGEWERPAPPERLAP